MEQLIEHGFIIPFVVIIPQLSCYVVRSCRCYTGTSCNLQMTFSIHILMKYIEQLKDKLLTVHLFVVIKVGLTYSKSEL